MIETPDTLGILNSRDKWLSGYSHKLDGGVAPFGLDVALPDQLDIDPSRMSVWLNFADGTRRDGVGDLLEVSGIRLERHRMNPICLFDHGKGQGEYDKWPIALAEDRDTKAYTVEIDAINRTARCNAFFYQGTGLKGVESDKEKGFALYCEQLYHLIAEKFIRAGSIGYQVIKGLVMQAEPERGVPQGLHLIETLMLEASAVIMPCNMDTVRKMLCMGKVCGKALSPVLVKSLQAQAPKQTKVVSGYRYKAAPEGAKFSSTQVDLPELKDVLHDWSRDLIPQGELADDGFEDKPHITVKYGLHTEDASEVQRAVSGFGPVAIKLGRTDVFPAKETDVQHGGDQYDVVYVSVDSKDLMRLNSLLANKLEHTDTHPRYKPHMTLAYVKPGMGKKYAGKPLPVSVLGQEITVDAITFCNKSRSCTELSLTGNAKGISASSRNGQRQLGTLPAEGSKETPVPLAKLPDTKIPPSRWKPGLGAIKELRKKHGKKALQPPTRTKPELGPNNIRDLVSSGDVLIARTYFSGPDGENFAHTGDRLEVQEIHGDGFVTVRNGRGKIAKVGPGKVRLKGLEKAMQKPRAELALQVPVPYRGLVKIVGEQPNGNGIFVIFQHDPAPMIAAGFRYSESWPMIVGDSGQTRNRSGWSKSLPKQDAKSIKVRYRNKVVKGYAEVQLKFDLSGLDITKQDGFLADMESGGFGRPHQGKWAGENPLKLNSALRQATYTFDVEPGKGNEADQISKAAGIAKKHGVRFLGSHGGKSLLANRGEKMAVNNPRSKSATEHQIALVQQEVDKANAELLRLRANGARQALIDQEEDRLRTAKAKLQHMQSSSKGMNGKAKGAKDAEPLPDGGDIEVGGGGNAAAETPGVEGENPPEKYSMQMTRQGHQDAAFLLEEYDAMLQHCEHEPTRELFTRKLEALVEELDEYEDHAKEHHPDAEPLEGAKELEEPEELEPTAEMETEADSSMQKEPENDEVEDEELEKMDTKDLRNRYIKGLRQQYAKKGVCSECGKENCKCSKSLNGRGKAAVPGDEEHQRKPGAQGVDPGAGTDLGAEEHVGKPGHDETGEEIPNEPGAEEFQEKPGESGEGGLLAHEKSHVGQAASFAHELENTPDFTDEHRMKSFHHGENLDAIARLGQADEEANVTEEETPGVVPGDMGEKAGEGMNPPPGTTPPAAGRSRGYRHKPHDAAARGIRQDTTSAARHREGRQTESHKEMDPDTGEEMGSKALHPHRIAAGHAAKFFKALSYEKAFGDPHRQQAAIHAKALDAVAQMSEEDDRAEIDEEDTPGVEPGEMQEKAAGHGINPPAGVKRPAKPRSKPSTRVMNPGAHVTTRGGGASSESLHQELHGQGRRMNAKQPHVKAIDAELALRNQKLDALDQQLKALEKILN